MPVARGPNSTQIVQVTPPLVWLKRTWADEWQFSPDLRVTSCSACTCGQDLDQAQLVRQYGSIKEPWESSFSARLPRDLAGWWCRIDAVDQEGMHTLFMGKIFGEPREIRGQVAGGPSGVQQWQAYGPMQLLRRVQVGQSYWHTGGEEPVLLGWLPPMNGRDELGTVVGNRSTDAIDNVYLYGGTEVWTNYRYLDYLLKYFVDESEDDGPEWTIDGQWELLHPLEDVIDWGERTTVAEMIRKLIPTQYGLDYRIRPTDDGFALDVFALSREPARFSDVELDGNPRKVSFSAGRSLLNPKTTVVRTADHRYGRIRVVGQRIVVCTTLRGNNVDDLPDPVPPGWVGTLRPRWSTDLETLYKSGTGDDADEPADHDAVRGQDQFQQVYQWYGAPDDWEWNGEKALPYFDYEAELDPDYVAEAQRTIRRTLNWIPLNEGWDYSEHPATDANPTARAPELLPPQVWCRDGIGRWLRAEDVGVSVSVPAKDWGVRLQTTPNHRLALNHFSVGGATRPTDHQPVLDYDDLVATIAFASDHRIRCEVALPDAKPSDGVLEIEVPDAELWYVVERTVVGVDPANPKKLVTVPHAVIVRDDRDKLRAVMASALNRYCRERARAEIFIKGLAPFTGLLGSILVAVEESGYAQPVEGPITRIQWQFSEGGAPETVIGAGYPE